MNTEELDAQWRAAAVEERDRAEQAAAEADKKRNPITKCTGPALLANLDQIWAAACTTAEEKGA